MPQEKLIEVPLREGQALGAVIDEELNITRVQEGSPADTRLKVGDRVLNLNGINIRNRAHYFERIRFARPIARVTVSRPDAVRAPDEGIPEDRKHFFIPAAGFIYKYETVHIARGQKLGLYLRSYQNNVLIVQVDPLSAARIKLMELDRIVEVDKYAMQDKLVATNFIIRAVRERGHFTCTLERPNTDATRELRKKQLHAEAPPPSIRLSADVLEIAREERERMARQAADDNNRRMRGEPATAVPQPPPAPHPALRVSFNETANVHHEIGNDNRDRELRPVTPQ